MKTSKLSMCIAALITMGFGARLYAQNEPPLEPSPARDSSRPPLSEPLHQKYTTDAWVAFQKGHYEAAITNADLCIARFGEAATRSQAALDSKKVILPTGPVSEAERKRIVQYEILNDVATSYLLKGWAEEKLGHTVEARKAYMEAKKLTHARSSRPTGDAFWSPAENASGHLASL